MISTAGYLEQTVSRGKIEKVEIFNIV